MTRTFTSYIWKVTLLNPVMGFQKVRRPGAINHEDAVDKAFREIRELGYDDGDFIVVELVRGAPAAYAIETREEAMTLPTK